MLSPAAPESTRCCTTLPTLSVDRNNRSRSYWNDIFKALRVNNHQPRILYSDCQPYCSAFPFSPGYPTASEFLFASPSYSLESDQDSAQLLCPAAGLSAWCLSLRVCNFGVSKCLEGRTGVEFQAQLNVSFILLLSGSSNPVCLGSSSVLPHGFLLF